MNEEPSAHRRLDARLVALALGLCSFALFAFRIGNPAEVYFDETHYVPAARALIAHSGSVNIEHPLFAKTMIAAGIEMFGDNSIAGNPKADRQLTTQLQPLAVGEPVAVSGRSANDPNRPLPPVRPIRQRFGPTSEIRYHAQVAQDWRAHIYRGADMQGQWLGEFNDEFSGTVRLELEAREGRSVGNAYLFYAPKDNLPGFMFNVNIGIQPPVTTIVTTTYLHSDGGIMTHEARERAEASLAERFGKVPIPAMLEVELKLKGDDVVVRYTTADGETETITLTKSSVRTSSELVGRADLTTWDQFREWAVDRRPRNFIFRGQTKPCKLSTTFHRTWRKNLQLWMLDDVPMLYGAMSEQISYPLELGNMAHNAAFWSLLQHHGYPTPLLDWTFSPFVAAYFAFADVKPDDPVRPRIYIFDQAKWKERYGKIGFTADPAPPQVVVLESYRFGNPRAGPQQALATVSNVADIESFIRAREVQDEQEYLTICELPAAEAPRILRELELMGITYGSLFPGLEGIARDMKDRLFIMQT